MLALKTFQRLDRVIQLHEEGVLVGSWDTVLGGLERAYEWMVETMDTHRIDTGGNPPIWAWSGTLRLIDAYLLFDETHELSTGYAVITFNASSDLVLLGGYTTFATFSTQP
ncbi:hypothetical protein [Pseudonocardia sp. ICBG162]|uniref:hypothetical protein n=1 Tax=Pseudonocardia sp. ICBG162 TaxID=2846761 RepID=UPI001CF63470|nr:hypothetical protein [Pseudonocardia sp. ICBG162]